MAWLVWPASFLPLENLLGITPHALPSIGKWIARTLGWRKQIFELSRWRFGIFGSCLAGCGGWLGLGLGTCKEKGISPLGCGLALRLLGSPRREDLGLSVLGWMGRRTKTIAWILSCRSWVWTKILRPPVSGLRSRPSSGSEVMPSLCVKVSCRGGFGFEKKLVAIVAKKFKAHSRGFWNY